MITLKNYLSVKLTKRIQDLYNETLMKEIKDLNKERQIYIQRWENYIIFKKFSKSTSLTQFQSKS